MLRALVGRIKATTVIAFLALTLATTGGAFASGLIKITSIKQIAPKVQKELRGKAGPAGPAGPAGAAGTGTPGPQGPQGPAGNNGSNGESVTVTPIAKGASECSKEGGAKVSNASGTVPVCNGKEGKQGVEGQPWTPNSQLPENATETGTWAFGPIEGAGGSAFIPLVSFTVQLAKGKECPNHIVEAICPEHVHMINSEGEEVLGGGTTKPPTECAGGTAAEPKAAHGNLCVFIAGDAEVNPNSANIFDPAVGESGASVAGAVLQVSVSKNAIGAGTWAVTG